MSIPSFLAFDLETSGLDAEKHEILSLAAIILDESLNELETFEIFAFPSGAVDPDAAKINGYTYETWKEKGAVSQAELFVAIQKFASKSTKLIPLGHNIKFDLGFLEALFRRHGTPKTFRNTLDYHALDTVACSILFDFVRFGKKDNGYKLENILDRFGIRNRQAHDALSDIRATVELFRAITQALGSPQAFEVAPPQTKSHLLIKRGEEWFLNRGKFQGTSLADVMAKEPDYLDWILNNVGELSEEQKRVILLVKASA